MFRIESPEQRRAFDRCVLNDLAALERLILDGRLERGVRRVGLEQEINLIGPDLRPAMVGPEVLADANAAGLDHVVAEYARFNLEINLEPLPFDARVMDRVHTQLAGDLAELQRHARAHDAEVYLAGILPTLRRYDIQTDALTPLPRYRMLFEATQDLKGGDDYEYHITGLDELHLRDATAVLGGTFTSLQLHWQTDPDQTAAALNWAQLLAGPQLAAAANSPIFLGKRLWHETRIALFAQTSDFRQRHHTGEHEPPRVTFGSGWCEQTPTGFLDIYREDALRHAAYMACDEADRDADPVEMAAALGDDPAAPMPGLKALEFHNGTVYRWNRPCFGVGGTPHTRIENRIIPAGPTLTDQTANAAFWWGLMAALPDADAVYQDLPGTFRFEQANRNFLAAAREGLAVRFHWPGRDRPVAADVLLREELVPLARHGLEMVGVPNAQDRLEPILGRADTGRNGAAWLLDSFEELRGHSGDDEALMAVTALGLRRQAHAGGHDDPVHTWPIPGPDDPHAPGLNPETATAGPPAQDPLRAARLARVDSIMTRDPDCLRSDDALELAVQLIQWRGVTNVPIVDAGVFKGLLDVQRIAEAATTRRPDEPPMPLSTLLRADLATVEPTTPTAEAVALMHRRKLECLPVTQGQQFLGLVTQADLRRTLFHLLSTA